MVIVVLAVLLVVYLLYTKKCECDKKGLILEMATDKLMVFFNHLSIKYFITNPATLTHTQKRVAQLLTRFSANNLRAISINNYSKETAYTTNKQMVYICLENKVYPYKIYNINTVMFVILHELAHVANDSWDHGADFWKLFKLFIAEAESARVYIPVDYKLAPEQYCNTKITYNPHFDASI